MQYQDSINIVLRESINSLSSQVTSFQNRIFLLESIRTWIPFCISLVGVGITFWMFSYNKKVGKRALLRTLLGGISQAKHAAEEIGIKMAPLLGKNQTNSITDGERTELNILNTTLESRNDRVLDELEKCCKSYYSEEVISKDFISELSEDIRRFVDGNQPKYMPPFTSYPNTVKFYDKICRRR